MKLPHTVVVVLAALSPLPAFAQTSPTAVPAPPVPVVTQGAAAPRPAPAPAPANPTVTVFGDVAPFKSDVRDLHFDYNFNVDVQSHLWDVKESARRASEDAMAQVDRLRDQWRGFEFQNRLTSTQSGSYSSALNYLNQRQFERAIAQFDRVIAQKESRADGAMYHKAFAQFRIGRSQDALETIAALRRDFPQSRYLGDAKVLEADIRRLGGQPINPAVADDDEIKLLAIQGLQRSEQAIPLLEGVLNATNTPAVKKRALFVLAQNEDPRARAILLRYAKGDGNPDLQMEAIRYLISRRDGQTSTTDLRGIYESTQDASVKMAIIEAFQSSTDKPALFRIVTDKAGAIELRGRAVAGLSSMATPDELWTLYQQETEPALRNQIVNAFGSMHAIDHLARVARTDADAGVRRRAIGALGGQRDEHAAKSRQLLLDLYTAQTDTAVRMSIINAFNNVEGAEALVGLARKETTLDLKKTIVQRLSELASRSKVAADYLMEVIK